MTVRRAFVAVLLLATAAAAQPEVDLAPPPWPDPAPTVVVATFSGEPEMVLAPGDPLILYVTIANDWAAAVRRINARRHGLLERFEQSEEYATLTEKEKQETTEAYRQLPVPEFPLGSETVPLSELIDFRVVDGDGSALDLELRSLAINDQVPARVPLAGEEPVLLRYAAVPGSLEGLPSKLEVQAFLDTREIPEMWPGSVESAPVTIRLADEAGDLAVRMRRYMTGTYYLDDRQFDRALGLAEELVQQDPAFIGGWLILGDALAGLERHEDALGAFRTAMDLYYQEEPPEGVPREHPEYTARRIREMEDRLAAVE